MNTIPTAYEIFDIASLGEDVSREIKMQYLWHCIEECVSDAIEPYRAQFQKDISFVFQLFAKGFDKMVCIILYLCLPTLVLKKKRSIACGTLQCII